MKLSGEVHLGGRLFNVVNYDAITALNESYIMKWMRRTELDKVLPAADGEDDSIYLLRLQAALNDTLELHLLLAGYLLPASKSEADWTPEMAADTAKHIAGVSDAESRAEVHRLGLLVCFDFFRAGIASINHSLSVLSGTIPPNESPNANSGSRAGH